MSEEQKASEPAAAPTDAAAAAAAPETAPAAAPTNLFKFLACAEEGVCADTSFDVDVGSLDKTEPFHLPDEYQYDGGMFCYDKKLWRRPDEHKRDVFSSFGPRARRRGRRARRRRAPPAARRRGESDADARRRRGRRRLAGTLRGPSLLEV